MGLAGLTVSDPSSLDQAIEKLGSLPAEVKPVVLPRTDSRPGDDLTFDTAMHLAARLQLVLNRPVHYANDLPRRCDSLEDFASSQLDGASQSLGPELLKELRLTTPTAADVRACEPVLDDPVGMAEFDAERHRVEFVVENLLAALEPMAVIAPSKSLKTTIVCDLALSMATATPFLDYQHFKTPTCRRRVLIRSSESGRPVIQQTLRAIARSKKMELHEVGDWLRYGAKLPQLTNESHLAALVAEIKKYQVEVLIMDPLYLCLLAGSGNKIDASNMFHMGPVFASVFSAIRAAGCTPVIVHHTTKRPASQQGHRPGKPSKPLDLTDAAYSGLDQFCRQWMLLVAREPYDPETGEHKLLLSVGGSVGHSGEYAVDVKKGHIKCDTTDPERFYADFSDITWDVRVRPAWQQRELDKLEVAKCKEAKEAHKQTKAAKIRDAIGQILEGSDGLRNRAIRAALEAQGMSISGGTLKDILDGMVGEKRIKRRAVGKYDEYSCLRPTKTDADSDQ
jgi:replicative DNA helicase